MDSGLRRNDAEEAPAWDPFIWPQTRDGAMTPRKRGEGLRMRWMGSPAVRVLLPLLAGAIVLALCHAAAAASLFDEPGRIAQAVARCFPHSFVEWDGAKAELGALGVKP